MSDDPTDVPLPDEVTISLPAVQALFGAIEQVLVVLERDHGPDSPEYRALDDALGRASRELLPDLGFFDDEG